MKLIPKRLVHRSAFAEFLRDAAEGQSSAFFYVISGGDEYAPSCLKIKNSSETNIIHRWCDIYNNTHRSSATNKMQMETFNYYNNITYKHPNITYIYISSRRSNHDFQYSTKLIQHITTSNINIKPLHTNTNNDQYTDQYPVSLA